MSSQADDGTNQSSPKQQFNLQCDNGSISKELQNQNITEQSLFRAGERTKFGRRERKRHDKSNNNARVRNSYLKLTMEDSVFDELHDLVQHLRVDWEDETNKQNQNVDGNAESIQQSVSKKKSRRQLTIKPRSKKSLHMTYFFAGTVLKDMPREELQHWESSVRNCVLSHYSKSSATGVGYSLRFDSFVTFPPNRQNLIVAVFESSPPLDDLYEELCNLALMEKEDTESRDKGLNAKPDTVDVSDKTKNDEANKCEFPLLRDLTLKQQRKRRQHASPSWIAHVTLGNIVGGSKEDLHRFSEWLSNRKYQIDDSAEDSSDGNTASKGTLSESNTATSSTNEIERTSSIFDSNINVLGLALGGPVPEHALDIDWNFPFDSSI